MTLIDVILVMFAAWLFTLVAFMLGVRVGRERYLVIQGPEKVDIKTLPIQDNKTKKEDFPKPAHYRKPGEKRDTKEDARS